jgi:hypothetical protein
MIDLGKQWPLNISFFADKCKCLVIANLDATEPNNHSLTIKLEPYEKVYFYPNGKCNP